LDTTASDATLLDRSAPATHPEGPSEAAGHTFDNLNVYGVPEYGGSSFDDQLQSLPIAKEQ
jgi:hypothetical protein